MNVGRCVWYCSTHGYIYAGLQDSSTCYCGNSFGEYGRSPDGDCRSGCHGDPEDGCGGRLRNSIYILNNNTPVQEPSSTEYVGCFADNIVRDLPYAFFSSNDITVEKCLDHCRKNNYTFAGTQYSRQCFCGSSFGRYGLRPETECRTGCVGAYTQTCGGTWRNTIYSLNGRVAFEEYSRRAFVGCYRDGVKRDLNGYRFSSSQMNILTCMDHCEELGYNYAGLQDSRHCYCGNSFGEYGKVPEKECKRNCAGSYYEKCGGTMRNSIYSLNGNRESEESTRDIEYIGCYRDAEARDLNGEVLLTDGRMKIETCIRICRGSGYSYAGLQYGDACFCDNDFGSYGKAAEFHCSRRCEGDSNEICGDYWRNSMYFIKDVKTPEPLENEPQFVGCYRDDPNARDLNEFHFKTPRMTIEKCTSFCAREGHDYAGLQWGTGCYCGSSFGKHGEAIKGDCNKTCGGDNSTICGGHSRNSIYSLSSDIIRLNDGWITPKNGFQYKLTSRTTTWLGAINRHCPKMGGRLAVEGMKNETTRKLIMEAVGKQSGDTWIGLSDREEEGVFRWGDGERASSNDRSLWAPGKPTSTRDCVCLNPNNKAADEKCWIRLYAMCEKLYRDEE